MIGVIPLIPYWHTGIILISQGETQLELVKYIDDCHTQDGDLKLFKKIHSTWLKLVRSKEVKEGIIKIEDKSNSVQATLFSEDFNENPLMLMVLPKSFDSSNYEHMITLAHECLHVCQAMLPKYLNRDVEEEAEAYFHSYIMISIVELIKN